MHPPNTLCISSNMTLPDAVGRTELAGEQTPPPVGLFSPSSVEARFSLVAQLKNPPAMQET